VTHPNDRARNGLTVTLTVNGQTRKITIDSGEALVTTLRDAFELFSVRQTCGIGICGTCSVLLDGQPINACLMLTSMVDGEEITTAEGLVEDERLSAVQQAFINAEAFQCSFCIPAMALSVHSALAGRGAAPSVDKMREYLGGNLCRCGTYPQVLQAVDQLISGLDRDYLADRS
jgi:aerobic-type carbon monoxide dehydrogenase small subunit (CoxS/CutS family)